MTPGIVLGPPGTGKTEHLLTVVEELLASGMEPEEICLVTFTRRAAEEAVTRAAEKFSVPVSRFLWFRTLHSLCFRVLGLSRGGVLTGKALREFADWTGIEISKRRAMDEDWLGAAEGDRIMHLDHLARVTGRPLRDVYDSDPDQDLQWSEVRRVAADLVAFKRARGLLDFTDMLQDLVIGPPPRLGVRALLVDEAQDLSVLQWEVVNRIAASNKLERFVVVGDDDQCIHEWAGASLQRFLMLEGNVRNLQQSWRVPQKVQELALGIIGQVTARRPKHWSPRSSEGSVVRVVRVEEAELTGETMVLARNHWWLERDVVPALRDQGVYYSLNGAPSVSGETLAALRGWERLRRGETVSRDVAQLLQRWLPGENRGRDLQRDELEVSALSWGILTDRPWHEALTSMPADEMSYVLAMRTRGEKLNEAPKVRLSTIHGSKGGQADHVVLLTDVAGRSAREQERDPDGERRVWYVGVTRAREKLTIVDRMDAPRSFSL